MSSVTRLVVIRLTGLPTDGQWIETRWFDTDAPNIWRTEHDPIAVDDHPPR